MKFMLSLLAFGYVALAIPVPSLPVNPGGIGGLFKGPNSEIIIKGPDGSIITSAAQGGEVHTNLQPIVVPEPVVIKEIAPVAVAVEPIPILETVAVPVSAVNNKQSSDLIGPSGRISTHGSQAVIAGPASTTVTGTAVVATTKIRGPPLIGTPVVAAAPPVVAVTPTPISLGSPVSLSPFATGRTAVVSVGTPLPVPAVSFATVTATPSIATVTAIPSVSVTAAPPVLTASELPPFSGVSVNSLGSNHALDGISAVTAAPLLPSTASVKGYGAVGIGNRADLTPQLIPDQIAIDNRQLNLNPALIPSVNIIPPEIPVTPIIPIGKRIPGVFTTPGLGSVATLTNIQREEADVSLSVTPNSLQVTPQVSLTPQQIAGLQSQQALLNHQIQHVQSVTPNIQRAGVTLSATPSSLDVNPQIGLNREQVLAIQRQQALLNNQIQHAQQFANLGLATSSNIQRDGITRSTTPNSLEVSRQIGLNREQILAIQSQQGLLNDQIQNVQHIANLGLATSSNIQRDGITLSTTPNSLAANRQIGLNREQILAIQSQQGLLNDQIQHAQQAANLGLSTSHIIDESTRTTGLFTPNTERETVSLANIPQQELLAGELARAGIDASQIQYTALNGDANVATVGSLRGDIRNGDLGRSWARYGRDAEKEKHSQLRNNN